MPHQNVLSSPAVIDLLLDAVCVVNAQGEFVFASAACETIFGYTPDQMVGRRMIDMVAPEDRERTLQAAQRVMSGETHLHFENRYLRKDGSRVHLMWSARWSEADQVRIAVARDITDRKRAEAVQAATYAISEAAHTAANVEELLHAIHASISDLLPSHHFGVGLLNDTHGELHFTACGTGTTAHGTASGPETDSVQLAFCHEVIRSGQAHLAQKGVVAQRSVHWPQGLTDGVAPWLGAPLQTQNGTLGAVILSRQPDDAPFSEADQVLLQYVSTQMASAIERKRLYHRLQHLAQFDALTGLPNRACLEDRLKTALARATREERTVCLLYLDLDHFKQVNDRFGHALGDQLLQDFAQRLKACVRESDTVARMSGDEFVVLLESGQSHDGNAVVAQKILTEFDAPFLLEGHLLHLRPSMGKAQYPADGHSAAELLRHADDAMYTMKHSRRNAATPQGHAVTPPVA